jgi:hypothetical protein
MSRIRNTVFCQRLFSCYLANSVEDAMEACARHVGRSRGRLAHYRSCYCCPCSVPSTSLLGSVLHFSLYSYFSFSYASPLKRMFSQVLTISLKITPCLHVFHFFRNYFCTSFPIHYLTCFKFLLVSRLGWLPDVSGSLFHLSTAFTVKENFIESKSVMLSVLQ